MPSKTIRTALAGLALAVGVVGCGHGAVTAEPGVTAVSSTSSEQTGPMVEVLHIWETTPLPPCKAIIVDNGIPDAPGAELPTRDTVSTALQGVKSPASEQWVHDELGWVTQWLIQTRSSINTAADPVAVGHASTKFFDKYVKHVVVELEVGHDIPDATLDNLYPNGCRA